MSEPADGGHTIHLTVIVPAIRAADNKVDAQIVFEFPLPPLVGQFPRKVRAIAKETDVFKSVRAADRAGSDWGAAKAE